MRILSDATPLASAPLTRIGKPATGHCQPDTIHVKYRSTHYARAQP